jgi:hypothetical protein
MIRGVKLLGLDSRNGRRYLASALAQAASMYEGAKVNVNHPKGHPAAARDYQDRLGSIRNVSVREGEGLFGDFQFNPKHALAEQLVWDASHAPENVGFSHNVEARTSRQGGQTVVEAILKVQSVDLVADPATTRGLFEAAGSRVPADRAPDRESLASVTIEQLRAARPDLVESILAEQHNRLAALESELDRLQACEAAHHRRAAAARLLKEFNLPDPDLVDAAARPLVSERFVEALVAAPNEQAMRALVEERACALEAARRVAAPTARAGRPLSREQHRSDPAAATLDARAFALAIS